MQSIHTFDGKWFSSDLSDALAFFLTAEPADVHDLGEVARALKEAAAIVIDRLAEIESNARITGTRKRRELARWNEHKKAVDEVLARYSGN